MPFQVAQRDIQHGHFHTAGDIDTNGIWDDSILSRQNAADRQTVADVGIGHERARNRDRQQAGLFHLHHGFMFESFSPLAIFDRFGPGRRRCLEQRFGKFAAQSIMSEGRRIGDDCLHFVSQAGLVSATENEFADEICCSPSRFAQRHA